MQSFKTHFPIRGIRTDVTVTPVDDNMFSIELESADAFAEETDPKKETFASRNPPNLIVQKTKSQDWIILNEGTFNLNQEDLKALGKVIENNSVGPL